MLISKEVKIVADWSSVNRYETLGYGKNIEKQKRCISLGFGYIFLINKNYEELEEILLRE